MMAVNTSRWTACDLHPIWESEFVGRHFHIVFSCNTDNFLMIEWSLAIVAARRTTAHRKPQSHSNAWLLCLPFILSRSRFCIRALCVFIASWEQCICSFLAQLTRQWCGFSMCMDHDHISLSLNDMWCVSKWSLQYNYYYAVDNHAIEICKSAQLTERYRHKKKTIWMKKKTHKHNVCVRFVWRCRL